MTESRFRSPKQKFRNFPGPGGRKSSNDESLYCLLVALTQACKQSTIDQSAGSCEIEVSTAVGRVKSLPRLGLGDGGKRNKS